MTYNTCNVSINNEHYYSDAGPKVLSNVATIAWTFPQFVTCLCCCILLSIIFGLLVAAGTNHIALGIFAILILSCCISSTYNGFKFYSAKTDLTNIHTDIKSNPLSRPCIDKTTNKIYT
jgi:hypothetical protein